MFSMPRAYHARVPDRQRAGTTCDIRPFPRRFPGSGRGPGLSYPAGTMAS
ncbi:hypothetical protein STXM2123_2162 [Streptomyces sp. F-3]|nr:hypothetical protein STXM2123_2162 [Streptomyces sp. F-3]